MVKRFSKRGRELKKQQGEVAGRRAKGGWPKKYNAKLKEASAREEKAAKKA